MSLWQNNVYIVERHRDQLENKLKERKYDSKKDQDTIIFIIEQERELLDKAKTAPRAENIICKLYKDMDEAKDNEKKMQE